MAILTIKPIIWCLSLWLGHQFLTPSVFAERTRPLPFSQGETIVYRVKWNGLKIGQTTLKYWGLSELEGKNYYKITSSADTSQYKGTDTIYADPQSFLPYRVFRTLRYMGKDEQIVEQYDAAQNRLEIVKSVNGKPVLPNQVIEKEHALQNSVLLYYLMRLQKFQLGQKIPVTLPTRDYQMTLVRKHNVSGLDRKKHKTWQFKSSPKGIQIWIDQEGDHLPRKMVFTKLLSVVTMDLKDVVYEPLKQTYLGGHAKSNDFGG